MFQSEAVCFLSQTSVVKDIVPAIQTWVKSVFYRKFYRILMNCDIFFQIVQVPQAPVIDSKAQLISALNSSPGGLLGAGGVMSLSPLVSNGVPAGMTALAMQNQELIKTLSTPVTLTVKEEPLTMADNKHMTLRTTVVDDEETLNKIAAAKAAAILASGGRSPDSGDDMSMSRKPRKGTPVKLCHTPPNATTSGEDTSSVRRQVFPEMGSSFEDDNASNTSSPKPPLKEVINITEDEFLAQAVKNSILPSTATNIGTMKVPIHQNSSLSPRAMQKAALNVSPTKGQDPASARKDILEAVAQSNNAGEALKKVQMLMLNGKQYEIVSVGEGQWVTRNEYDMMRELSEVVKPAATVQETSAKTPVTLKVPVVRSTVSVAEAHSKAMDSLILKELNKTEVVEVSTPNQSHDAPVSNPSQSKSASADENQSASTSGQSSVSSKKRKLEDLEPVESAKKVKTNESNGEQVNGDSNGMDTESTNEKAATVSEKDKSTNTQQNGEKEAVKGKINGVSENSSTNEPQQQNGNKSPAKEIEGLPLLTELLDDLNKS